MSRPSSRFFTHGEVRVDDQDSSSGQLSVSVTVPACVMQAVTPQLLGAGYIDSYEVRRPLAVWVPTVSDVGFLSADPLVCTTVNARMRSAAAEAVRSFAEAERVLRFPGDALPLLPLGTYVTFRLRCTSDSLASSLAGMGGAAGVAELRASLASVLASVLAAWGRTGPESLPPAPPARLGKRSRQGRHRQPP